MQVFGPVTLEIRGYITYAVTIHNIMEATGDNSGISVTARKMCLPIDFLFMDGNVH